MSAALRLVELSEGRGSAFTHHLRVGPRIREFHFRSIAEMPRHLIQAAATNVWNAFDWGLIDPSQATLLDSVPMSHVHKMSRAWQDDAKVTTADLVGILGLIDEHGDALEADLINAQMRLRDFPSERCNWRDLIIFVKHLDVESNTYGEMYPESAGWTKIAMLLADIDDSTGWLQWAKTKAAADGGDPPDRMPRPGVKPRELRKGSRVKAAPISRIKKLAGIGENSDDRMRKLAAIFR